MCKMLYNTTEVLVLVVCIAEIQRIVGNVSRECCKPVRYLSFSNGQHGPKTLTSASSGTPYSFEFSQ